MCNFKKTVTTGTDKILCDDNIWQFGLQAPNVCPVTIYQLTISHHDGLGLDLFLSVC